MPLYKGSVYKVAVPPLQSKFLKQIGCHLQQNKDNTKYITLIVISAGKCVWRTLCLDNCGPVEL